MPSPASDLNIMATEPRIRKLIGGDLLGQIASFRQICTSCQVVVVSCGGMETREFSIRQILNRRQLAIPGVTNLFPLRLQHPPYPQVFRFPSLLLPPYPPSLLPFLPQHFTTQNSKAEKVPAISDQPPKKKVNRDKEKYNGNRHLSY